MAKQQSVLPDHWPLQTAKSRLSELVRRIDSNGPQHITIHGREIAVVISAAEFRRLTGRVSGLALIEALQASPSPELDIIPDRFPMPVRSIAL